MAKLGPVPPPPAPIDPFRGNVAPAIGVVPTSEVTVQATQSSSPKLGVVTKRPTIVVNVPPPEAPVLVGPVAPAITPPPAPPPSAPAVGIVQDTTPVYPPPPPERKPELGTIVHQAITAPPPPDEEMIGAPPPPPAVSQPVVVDPFKREE